MNYENKKKRLDKLARIPPIAQLDHRLLLDKNGELPFLSQLTKNERRKLDKNTKELTAKYLDILDKIKKSGVGFPIDKLIRELAYEYTHRYANSGVGTQPLSFNYFESFCNIRLFSKSFAPYAIPTTEIDHIFNVTDYFDFLTSEKTESFDLSSLMELTEDKTLHFTTNGDVMDFSFLNAEGREFVISGFSMIRRHNSLHWYLLGGEIITEEEWILKSTEKSKIDIESLNSAKKAYLLESVKEHNYECGAPIALEGTDTAIRTIIAGEIDLMTHQYMGRCLMSETENSFDIICDDPEVFNKCTNVEKRQEWIENMREQVTHVSVMWDLASSMFQLPSYFAYKVAIQKNIVIKAGNEVKKIKPSRGKGIGAQYKTVSSIEIIDLDTPVIRPLIPQHYKTNTEGHWRRLTQGTIGKGPDGSKEVGRTWVKAKNTWRETNNSLRTIYVKSTIKAAELKANEYKNAATLPSERIKAKESNEKDYGELYVLRCIVMEEELYKVGWTSGTSENRAKELSSATGVPISFIVVDSWKHKDAEALEKSVHAMLDSYRVNDRREFFQAKYRTIKKIIELEIERSYT
jgi:hypothetical protein